MRSITFFIIVCSISCTRVHAQYQPDEPQDTARTLEQIIVTGQYRPQSLRQSVYKVRIIDAERIKLRGATDVQGILNNEAGLRFNTDHTLGETDINIMGMSGQNVKILLDGIPLADRGSTKQSLSQIDINTIERIEIVEGPMSVSYGTDALAGVINLITKKNKGVGEHFALMARIQEEATGSYYSPFVNEGAHHESVGINWNAQQWYASGSLTRNSFGGWTGNAAFRAQEAKPKDQYILGGTIGHRNKTLNTRYRLDFLDEEIYVAGALNTGNYRAKDQHYYTKRFTHQLHNEWDTGNRFRLTTATSYQDYKRSTETYTIDYTDNSKTLSPDAGEQDVTRFKTFFLRSAATWTLSEQLSLQPGIEVKHDHTSGQRIEGAPSIADYALFLSAEIKPFAGWSLRPGIRFSKNSIYDAPPVMPSINTKFSLGPKTELRLSYAKGFRAPILRELYFYYFDANHSIQGNPNLKAETANSFQASVARQILQREELSLNVSLSGFYNEFKNRISMAAGANNIFSYFNIDVFKTTGATVENNFKWKRFSATLGAACIGRYNLYAKDKNFSQQDLPQFTWSPEITSNINFTIPKIKADIGLFYKYTGKLPSYNSLINPNTGATEIALTSIEAYHWADLTFSKQLFKLFTVQAGAKNIFDVVRLSNTSDGSGGAHSSGGPILTAHGRSYFLGLLFQWSKSKIIH